MLAGAGLQRRRRQPVLWPMNADPPPPPPWVWMVPGSPGLLRLGAGVAPPPVLLAAAQPPAAPLLPGLPGWQAPGEPLLPLVPLPSAPDRAAAAAHGYPLLPGQVRRPAPPRARVLVSARPLPWAAPAWAPRPSAPGGPGSPTSTAGSSLAAVHRPQSSRLDVPLCPQAVSQYFPRSLSQAFLGDQHPKARAGTEAAASLARPGALSRERC